MFITKEAEKRVRELLIDTEECIYYPVVSKDGYGLFQTTYKGKKLHLFTHRIAYQIATGEDITSENIICHKCDNPACINPKHLFKGTHADNVADKVRKGRQAKGPQNGRYIDGRASDRKISKPRCPGKLSFQKVMEVRTLRKTGNTITEIAKVLDIPVHTVKDIIYFRAYKNVI